MNPVLAMTRGLDVQLWVSLMEIKGHPECYERKEKKEILRKQQKAPHIK